MANLDKSDLELLSALRKNSRASITTLASELNLSRITVRTRIDRLLSEGWIEAFTIKVNEDVNKNVIRALMLYQIDHSKNTTLANSLLRMGEVIEIYSTNGRWDGIAVLEAPNLVRFDELLREICALPGMVSSETNILLNSVRKTKPEFSKLFGVQ